MVISAVPAPVDMTACCSGHDYDRYWGNPKWSLQGSVLWLVGGILWPVQGHGCSSLQSLCIFTAVTPLPGPLCG